MKSSGLEIVGGALVAIGLAASSIFSFAPDLEGTVPGIARVRLLYILVSLLLIGVGVLLIAWSRLESALIDWLAQRSNDHFFVKHARPHELSLIFRLARRYFGEDSSPEDAIIRFHRHDKKFIHVVKSARRSLEKDVEEAQGYFIVFRLTDAGERAIQEGSFAGAAPPSDHLAKPGASSSAAYIGALVARMKARPYALAALETHLKQDGRYAAVKMLYAKAATKEGYYALKRWRFIPLPGHADGVGSMFTREHEYES